MEREKICLLIRDRYLLHKLRLELSRHYEPVIAEEKSVVPPGVLTVADLDEFPDFSRQNTLFLSRDEALCRKDPAILRIPTPIGEVLRRLKALHGEAPPLLLSRVDCTAILYGEPIRLTELEFSLLAFLISYKGEIAPREEILRWVFGEGRSPGLLNVYIHYLREKLEHGEKIILSSRGGGYRIAPQYIIMKER